jgi:hypothetical protein
LFNRKEIVASALTMPRNLERPEERSAATTAAYTFFKGPKPVTPIPEVTISLDLKMPTTDP